MKGIGAYSVSKTEDVSKFYGKISEALNFKAGGMSG
jgi:hypothetical protein